MQILKYAWLNLSPSTWLESSFPRVWERNPSSRFTNSEPSTKQQDTKLKTPRCFQIIVIVTPRLLKTSFNLYWFEYQDGHPFVSRATIFRRIIMIENIHLLSNIHDLTNWCQSFNLCVILFIDNNCKTYRVGTRHWKKSANPQTLTKRNTD